MSFLYPRTVSVHRPAGQTGEGKLAYGGASQAGETEIATGLSASIQKRREGQKSPAGLPADGTRPTWLIFVPRGSLALGAIKDRDIIIDDLGVRYQVLADGWDSLGYAAITERLEA